MCSSVVVCTMVLLLPSKAQQLTRGIAGPCGLEVALSLLRQGVSFRIIGKFSSTGNEECPLPVTRGTNKRNSSASATSLPFRRYHRHHPYGEGIFITLTMNGLTLIILMMWM